MSVKQAGQIKSSMAGTGATLKLWIGVGTVMLATQFGQPVQAADSRAPTLPPVAGPAATPVQGGEGGEAGDSGTFAKSESNLKFVGTLAIIQGHLLVGHELLEADRPGEALPHFQHPIEENYPAIERELAKRHVKPFKVQLEKLAALIEQKAERKAIDQPYFRLLAMVETAAATVPRVQRESAAFLHKEIQLLMAQASDEYSHAVDASGRITRPLEYQDGRGFYTIATRLFERYRAVLHKRDREAAKQLGDKLQALGRSWPSAVAPPRAVVSREELSGGVAQIDALTARFR